MPSQSDISRGTHVVGEDGFGNQIHAFNSSGIQAQIDQALATLKPGAHGAVIGTFDKDADTPGTIRLAVISKPFGSDKFSAMGFLGHTLDQDWSKWDVGAAVRYEF